MGRRATSHYVSTAAWDSRPNNNLATLRPGGAICQQEMTATFCNVPTSTNNGGYGSGGGAAATSAGIAVYTKLSRLSGRK